MKKLLALVIVSMFLLGCASLKESGYWEHDTIYASTAHMAYSMWGYKNPDANWQKLSQDQGWWGTEVPYIPAK